MAGMRWMRVAEDRPGWRVIGEVYVQKWTVMADTMMMMIVFNLYRISNYKLVFFCEHQHLKNIEKYVLE
jgi:hypothetical protein